MKKTNLIFKFLLLPIIFLMRFYSSQNFNMDPISRELEQKKKKAFIFELILVFAILSPLQLSAAVDVCPGTTLINLHNTSSDATQVVNTTLPASTTYYYTFTPTVTGKIQVDSSANKTYNSLFIRDVTSGCPGSNLWSNTNNSQDKSSPAIDVVANQQIVIAFERRYSSSIDVQLNFTFTVSSLKETCPGDVLNTLDGTSVTANQIVTGMVPANSLVYYHFTPTASGTVQVDSSMSNGSTYNSLFIRDVTSGCPGSNLWSNTSNSNTKSSPEVSISAGQTIVIAYERRYSSDRDFALDITYTVPIATAVNDWYTTEPDTQLVVNAANGLLSNDTGPGISITAKDLSSLAGSKTIDDDTGAFTFDPTSGFTGPTSFTYTITDSANNESTALVEILVAVDTNYDSVQGFDLVNPDNTRNIIGDYKIAGNTVLCLTTNRTTLATSENQCVDTTNMNSDATSNNYISKFIDIDGDASTWNSSSSYITLPNSYKTVLWAGLFWQGRFANGTLDRNGPAAIRYAQKNGSSYSWVNTSTSGAATFTENFLSTSARAQEISLKIDRGLSTSATYNTVTASKMYYNAYSSGITYSARADVTYLLRQAALEAEDKVTFTVANLPTSEGREETPGIYGGWSLVVIYAEDLLLGKPRNITLHSGMKTLDRNSGDQTINITGFKLPSSGNTVSASLSMFAGEGEFDYRTDGIQIKSNTDSTYQNMPSTSSSTNIFDAKMDGITRDTIANHKNNLQNNNVGVEVDDFNLSAIMSAYDRDNTNTLTLKMYSNQDYIIPAMLIFKTELYQPTICYDYTLEVGGYIIPSENNIIDTGIGSFTDKPMVTRISIQSREGDYDFQDVNLTYNIVDTSDTQYISGTTKIAKNSQFAYVDASGQTISEGNDGFLIYLGDGASDSAGGVIKPYEKRFLKFENEIENNVDTQFSLIMEYTIDYGGVTRAPGRTVLDSKAICRDDGGYFVGSDIFNVTSTDASTGTGKNYNLYTQVVNRPFDVRVFSHDIDHINTDHRLKVANTAIEVEIFNADIFPRDVNLSCLVPDSNISSSTFVDFTNDTSVPLSGFNIDYAVRNAGFRTWYLRRPDNSVVNHHCTDLGAAGQSCFKTVYVDELKTYETAENNCTTQCNASTGCYPCLRKYFGNPICSKDNFSVRPEAFVVDLLDNLQQTDSRQPTRRVAHSANLFGVTNESNVSAGYDYRFDINATSHTGDSAVNGYYRTFDSSSNTYSSTMQLWNKTAIDNSGFCNDTSDKNVSFTLFNGTNVNNYQHINELGGIDQTGLYEYKMKDSNWTVVDWHKDKTTHHIITNPTSWNNVHDCVDSNGFVNNTGKPGCEIQNSHLNNGTGVQYNELNITFNPYSINIGLSAYSPIRNNLLDNEFVYINTVDEAFYPNGIDENMSYNIQGTISARGWSSTPGNGTMLSNFVKGCFAQNLDMNLSYTYLSAIPGTTPNLRRDIVDHNSSDTSVITRPRQNNISNNVLTMNTKALFLMNGNPMYQNAEHFAKDMQGTLTMDLGLNFDRTYDTPLNPRRINFADFNISLQSNANINVDKIGTHKVFGNLPINQDVTFLYAKAKPGLYFYDDIIDASVVTPISVATFCDLGETECRNRGLQTSGATEIQTNEAFWWRALNHTDVVGNIAFDIGSSSGSPSISPKFTNITTNGEDATITVGRGATPPLPFIVPIELTVNDPAAPAPANYTDRWLIYNVYNPNTAPSPFYRVRFIGNNSNWTGHGKTGHVVDDQVNQRKSRRLEW